MRRENAGWVSRSLSVAGLVPRSAATSSEMLSKESSPREDGVTVGALRAPALLFHHQRSAARARLRMGSLPDGELALGVAVAPVEGLPLPRAFDDQLALLALRASHTGLLFLLLDVSAFGVAGA